MEVYCISTHWGSLTLPAKMMLQTKGTGQRGSFFCLSFLYSIAHRRLDYGRLQKTDTMDFYLLQCNLNCVFFLDNSALCLYQLTIAIEHFTELNGVCIWETAGLWAKCTLLAQLCKSTFSEWKSSVYHYRRILCNFLISLVMSCSFVCLVWDIKWQQTTNMWLSNILTQVVLNCILWPN